MQFFIGGLVVPLIATVGINNKVTFLEKHGTSEYNNSTGAYELDLSLVDNYQLAWREMHVQSDVFCSGSIVLPDKGGRFDVSLGISGSRLHWNNQANQYRWMVAFVDFWCEIVYTGRECWCQWYK
jgi:hypothetical protein